MSERKRPSFEVLQGGKKEVGEEVNPSKERTISAIQFHERMRGKIREMVLLDSDRILSDEEVDFLAERIPVLAMKPKASLEVHKKLIALKEINDRFPELTHLFYKSGKEDGGDE